MDKHTPKTVSLLICAYNEEKTIGNKIENILSNDRNDSVKEIIIVDDNSFDKTIEIVDRYAQEYEKITALKNTHKKGKWGALVTGYGQAQGEIICISDADVMFEKDTLENALVLFDDLSVGGVSANQKNRLDKNGNEGQSFVSRYEMSMNLFRTVTSAVCSNVSSHGQCLFVRKAYLDLPGDGLMADDVYISILLSRKGYRVLFSKKSYYIEKLCDPFDKNSKKIFYRRAMAIAEAMIKNKDIIFNPRYKKFGLICFPIWFFLYVVFPFLVIIVLGITVSFLLRYGHIFLLLIFLSMCIFCYKLLVMIWFQAVSVIKYIIKPKGNMSRWETCRNG